MICPSCGSRIPDGSRACPACGSRIARPGAGARRLPAYCPRCGSIVPEGARACPACGSPVLSGEGQRRLVNDQVASRLADPAAPASASGFNELSETRSMPRLDAALPPEPEAGEEPAAHPYRLRAIVLAAIAALVVVGGGVLYITHPWDPRAFSTSATVPADTSQAGFPGTLDSLSGQDKDASASADEDPTYATLHAAWEELGDIRDSLTANRESFEEVAYSGTDAQRQEAAEQAEQDALALSNLISEISSVSSESEWAQVAQDLLQLGNWLRNYADNLCAAWDAVLAADDPAAAREDIDAILGSQRNADGRNTYEALFDNAYAGAEPERP